MNNDNDGLVVMDAGLSPIMDLSVAKQRLREFQEFVKEYLVEGEDYGLIPGTPKPTLYKPGADKLCELYGLADDYVILDKVEDFDKGLFDYNVKCILTSKLGKFLVATGLGSCNSYEGRYRWREGKRKCPNCGSDAIIKGKAEYGGGWICFAKKGGCGAKYLDKDQKIVGQEVGKVQNDDIATMKNTILKMGKKRAKIDAVLSATRSAGRFTQDLDDIKQDQQEPPEDFRPQAKAKATPSPTPRPAARPEPPQAQESVSQWEHEAQVAQFETEGKGATYDGEDLTPKARVLPPERKFKGDPKEKLSAKQRQLFWADCKKTGADDDMIRAAVLEVAQVESTKDIFVHQTGEIIERLREMVQAQKGAPSPFDEEVTP